MVEDVRCLGCPSWRGLQRDMTAGAACCWHRQHPGHRLGGCRIKSYPKRQRQDLRRHARGHRHRRGCLPTALQNLVVWKAVPRSRSPTSPLRTSGGRAGPGRGEVRLRDGGAVLGGRAPLHEHCHRKHNHSAVTTQSAHRYSTVTAQGHRTQTQRRNSTHAHLRTGTASTPARPRGCLCARRRRRRVGG